VLCGPHEQESARRIVEQSAQAGVVSLAGQPLSIGLSKACVRRSALMVSTDSGPRHFAAAFGVPLVTLYGPTHPAWSDLHYPLETKLSVPVDCGPCQQSTCQTGDHRCMTGLEVDVVLRAVVEQLRAVRCSARPAS
jgi:heptosyltransferase-2